MCKQRLGALCGCKMWVYLTTKGLVMVLGAGARCWSILQSSAKLTSKGLVSYRVLSKGAGLSYNQKLGVWCGGRVRCGFILHPSFSLVLGLVLRERIKSKE